MKHIYRVRIAVSLLLSCTLVAMMAMAGCSASNRSGTLSYPSTRSGKESANDTQDMMMSAAEGEAYTGSSETWYPEPDFNTEEYNAISEQGFIRAGTRPLSTLSADVDTASYCNVRRMINGGQGLGDIPQGALRIEEMLNYFNYSYPDPARGDLFSMTAQLGPCPWNADTNLLVLGCATATGSCQGDVKNLVFLIDTSGSMKSSDKLPLLKDSLGVLVDNLDGRDRISIVTYATDDSVALEAASGDEKQKINRAIERLEAKGSTNGEAGLNRAYQIARDNYIEGGINRIILASDGDLNVGKTSESELREYVAEQRKSGVYLSVLGFGSGNYKDNKMEALADNGNGSYRYIDCIDEAEKVFNDELSANLVALADDVKLQVEFNPAQVKGYRLIGYENRAMQDAKFEDDAADACEVGEGSQFTVAYEIVPVGSSFDIPASDLKYGSENSGTGWFSPKTDELLTCTLRYKPAGQDTSVDQQLAVSKSAYAEDPGDDWRFASALIEFGMIARKSEYAANASIDSVVKMLEGMRLNKERKGFLDLVKKA